MADLTLTSTDYASELRTAIRDYKSLALLKASTESLTESDIVTAGGYRYQVAASAATDHDVARDDGEKLYVLPSDGAVWDEQWFDIADDADRVQAAIDWTIAQQKDNGLLYKVMVLGDYSMSKPLKLFDFDGVSTFTYVSVHIEAPAQGYVNNQRTEFNFTDLDQPGLVIQKVRQVRIKNISIVGGASITGPSYDDLLASNNWWNTQSAVESGSYKIYTGILIDPFISTMSAGDKFTFFDGSGAEPDHYVTSSSEGSTQIQIDGCEVQNFVHGINCGASGVQIGDSITIKECNFTNLKVCVIAGESQNRGIAVNDCHAKNFDVLWANGSGFSEGTGPGNYVNGGVFVFGYALINADTGTGNGSFTNVYAESIWTFGYIGTGHGWTFKDCQIKILSNQNRHASLHLAGGGNVNFIGGYYGLYDNVAIPLHLDANFIVMGATFDMPPIRANLTNGGYCDWVSGHTRYGNPNGLIGSVGNGGFSANLGRAEYSWIGHKWQDGESRVFECKSGYRVISIGTATVSISAGVVSLTSIDTDNIFVGDVLSVLTNAAVSDNRNSTVTRQFWNCGRITSIDTGAGSCDLELASNDLSDTDVITVYLVRFPTIRQPQRGTTTASSTNVSGTFVVNDWPVGCPIQGEGIPSGARVAAITTSSITLTKAATQSGTTDIYDGVLWPSDVTSKVAPTSGDWPTGSFVRNSEPTVDGNNMLLLGWSCTAGGSPGTWAAVYGSNVTPAS